MAYAQGDIILDDHYNIFATGGADGTANHSVANINSIWGVGSGDKGYGQSTVLEAVTAGELITASQWSTMIARLDSVLGHQTNAGTDLTQPTTGDIIAFIDTLSGNISTAYTDRGNFFQRGTTTTGSNLDTTWSSTFPTTNSQTRTVTFSSSDAARYFFNAGGRINIALSVLNSTDNDKESSWNTLINTGVGTFSFDYTSSSRSGTGSTLSINNFSAGFWDMTNTDTTIFRLSSTATFYTANYVEILCRVTGTAGDNGGLGNVLTFTINYNDGSSDDQTTVAYTPPTDPPGSVSNPPVQGDFGDTLNLTLRARCDIIYPETTYLTDTWGTATVS
jgi:hypothetical protein